MNMAQKLLVCRFPRPDAKVRLVFFPWAGGGAAYYVNTGNKFPEKIEVWGVCLAGREGRFKEPPCNSLSAVLEELVTGVYNVCKDKPVAFFGHSLGAILSYETATRLKSRYNIEPVRMFVSGVSAPQSELKKQAKRKYDTSKYTDDEFIEFLRKLNGTPAEVLNNKELMSLFLPSLRADYSLVDQHDCDKLPPLDQRLSCPIDIFDGVDDVEHDLEGWREVTTGPSTVQKLPGAHFYLKDPENMGRLVQHITDSLR
ncbi:hypothetical protein ACJMK2_030493 [Sinanodonta woodiana]|uniref:oleoyl-[acyl-carrier-protein] hydrolase n=1 Tax=Sinanodonta woodiana TaxID=1069815 RepID=A0ABD3WVW9_SINWO